MAVLLSRRAYGVARGFRNAALGLALLPAAAMAQEMWAQEGAAQEVTVAALGDSLTAGYGLAPSDGFVPRLQAWLDERDAGVTVVNAGVSGDSTAGGLARADWTLTEDVDAMILALGGNDWLRGTDPAVSRANLDGILDKADARGIEALIVGIDAGGNYGPAFEAAFDGMYRDLAAEHDALLVPDWFGAIRVPGQPISASAPFLQPDGIHPNAEGVRRIVEALGPEVLELAERARAAP